MSAEQEYTCAKCGDTYSLDPELNPTMFCNTCAQALLEEILKIVPNLKTQYSPGEGLLILQRIQEEIGL